MKRKIAWLLVLAMLITGLIGCGDAVNTAEQEGNDISDTLQPTYTGAEAEGTLAFLNSDIEIGYGTTVAVIESSEEKDRESGITYAELNTNGASEWHIAGVSGTAAEDPANCMVEGNSVTFNYPGQYSIDVEAVYADGSTGTASVTVSVVDKIPPVITVESALEVMVGTDLSSRKDYPVKAVDEIDGEIDVEIDLSAVDIMTQGSYKATVTAKDLTGNTAVAELNINVVDKVSGYTYKELSTVMYASAAVNVRDLPSSEGKKIGSLKAAQEVSVTGQCVETSWYRIDYNGKVGYVSPDHLTSKKPSSTKAPAEEKTPDVSEPPTPKGLVSINKLQNRKSIKQKCTDAEFREAYDAAVKIVTPPIGKSKEEQLEGIASALRKMVDSGQVEYSTNAPHYNDPYGYLVLGVSSCAGCTRTTGLCLNMLGISYEHVNENQWTHQWCRVNIDGTYWICDAYGLYVGPEPAPREHPYL